MKKSYLKIFFAAILAFSLTSCAPSADSEIQIPIYEGRQNDDYTTVKVERMHLSSGEKIGAFLGYAFSDALSAPQNGNLVSYNISKYDELKEGDVIAVIDSSALDYTYRRQEIMTEAAHEVYLASGTEKARLEYEYEKSLLDSIQYEIDSYTITAPYDCVISDAAPLTEGQEIETGTYICSIARGDEIYAYINENLKSDEESKFRLGAKVNVTLTGSSYEGTVISVPKSGAYRFELKYSKENMMFEAPKTGPVAADSSRNVIIGFEPEVLEQLLIDTPNAVVAGWATVFVTTREMNNVLAVPTGAVSKRDNSYVYIVNNGQRIQTPVLTGGTIDGYTIITAGLSEGDTICTSFK